MTDSQVALWLVAVGTFELMALFLFSVFVIEGGVLNLHKILKLGLMMLSFGLVVQILRSIHYLNFGYYPVDRYVPLWAMKDIGGALILYYFSFVWKRSEARFN